MLIPSIDLQNGHVVQLVQGERLAIEAPDAEPWIQRFARFPRVQLIDLDAARGRGDNSTMVASICRLLPCRVCGGIRSIERAQDVLASGAHAVIASSALFRDGRVDIDFLTAPRPTGEFRAPSDMLVAEKKEFGSSRRARWPEYFPLNRSFDDS